MAELVVRGLHKSYGRVRALSGVDLTVHSGALVAVLGPSGCGKTTLLRCVAGFCRAGSGTVVVAGRDVAGLPPERRRIAVVPQEGALFPHLSVRDNVGYGLDRAARRNGRVEEVLALVGLSGLDGRMPHELSGGQQQRVAVARALAPHPPVVLLDEPFSALDAGLRADVRRDVRAALRADGATAVLVTHDQGEALSMADEVAVMRDGRIIQCGPPTEVYTAPLTPWVAGFVGEAVWLPGTLRDGAADTAIGRLAVAGWTGPASGPGRATRVLLRPEQVAVFAGGEAATVDGCGVDGPGAVLGGGKTELVDRDVHGSGAVFTGGETATVDRCGVDGPDAVPAGGEAASVDRCGVEGRDAVPAGGTATVDRCDFHGHDALLTLRLPDGTAVTARVLGHDVPQVGSTVGVRVTGPARAFPPAPGPDDNDIGS